MKRSIHIASCGILVLVFVLGINQEVKAQQNKSQYAFKAAFIFRFLEYIDWPSRSTNFNFSVLGTSPVTAQMKIIAGQNLGPHSSKIVVQEFSRLEDIPYCHILFIAEGESDQLSRARQIFRGRPVLIITEKDGLADQGADINFILSDTRLKFEFNLKSLSENGLKVSSNLLKHAIIVNGN